MKQERMRQERMKQGRKKESKKMSILLSFFPRKTFQVTSVINKFSVRNGTSENFSLSSFSPFSISSPSFFSFYDRN